MPTASAQSFSSICKRWTCIRLFASKRKGRNRKKLRPKAFDVLRSPVENAGRIISKEELIRSLCPTSARVRQI